MGSLYGRGVGARHRITCRSSGKSAADRPAREALRHAMEGPRPSRVNSGHSERGRETGRRALLLQGLTSTVTLGALGRTRLVGISSSLGGLWTLQNARRSEARASDVPYVGSEVPSNLAEVFTAYVSDIQQRLGPSFDARLAIYGVTQRLPAGIPGDPARDYSSNRRNCGEFRKPGGFPSPIEPYAICDDVTCTSEEKTKCCRHYAYCVPYDTFPANKLDAVSTVMVSSRIVNLPEATIRGILAHELGHAVDFHMFGKRYRLKNKAVQVSSEDLEVRLREIDATVDDVEFRADDFANVLMLEGQGQRLCYDRNTKLQRVRTGWTATCGEQWGEDDHFPHPVLRRPIL